MEHLTLEQLRLTHSDKQPAAPPAGSPAPERTGTPNFRKGGQAAAASDQPKRADTRSSTLNQRNFIRDLLAKREGNVEAEQHRANVRRWMNEPGGMTFAAASGTIDALKKIDPNVRTLDQAAHEATAKGFRPRPNKYAGECAECNRTVGEGEGLLLGKDDHGDWAVSHKPGECQSSDFPFPFGRYALEEADGTVKFYVASEDGFFAQASDDLFPVTNKDNRDAIIVRIAEDPKAAAIRYGLELEVCGRCGRTLTSEWRKVGIGPVCAEKAW